MQEKIPFFPCKTAKPIPTRWLRRFFRYRFSTQRREDTQFVSGMSNAGKRIAGM